MNNNPPPLRSHLSKLDDDTGRNVEDLSASSWDIQVTTTFNEDQEEVRIEKWEDLEDHWEQGMSYRHDVRITFAIPDAMWDFNEAHRAPENRDPFENAQDRNAEWGWDQRWVVPDNIEFNSVFGNRFIEPRGYRGALRVTFHSDNWTNIGFNRNVIFVDVRLPEHMDFPTVQASLEELNNQDVDPNLGSIDGRNFTAELQNLNWDFEDQVNHDIFAYDLFRYIFIEFAYVRTGDMGHNWNAEAVRIAFQNHCKAALSTLIRRIANADLYDLPNNVGPETFEGHLNPDDTVEIQVRKHGSNPMIRELRQGWRDYILHFQYQVAVPPPAGDENIYEDDEWEQLINEMKNHMGAVMASFCREFLPSFTTRGRHATQVGVDMGPQYDRWKLKNNFCYTPGWWRHAFFDDAIAHIPVLNNTKVRVQDDNWVLNETPKLKF